MSREAIRPRRLLPAAILTALALSACARPDNGCPSDPREYLPGGGVIQTKCMSDGTACRGFHEVDADGVGRVVRTTRAETKLKVCRK